MAMGKNKKPIYESRAGNMKSTNAAGFKATALRLAGTTPFSRGLNSLRHLPLAQVSNTQPISRNGDGITPLHYGYYPAALTRNNAPNTSTFKTSPPSPPMLEEESMDASVAGFENRMAEDDSNVEHFPAWSPFDEPLITIDKEQQPENVPPQQSYDILDCPNALNDSALYPRTLLSDNLNWPDFSQCLRSEKTPPLQPTTSPLESLNRTGPAHVVRSGNIPAPKPTKLPFGSHYVPYYPKKAYGPVPTTLPSWNPYWTSYPNGQGSQSMVPPPLVPAALPHGSVGRPSSRPYYHGFGTRPSWSPSYPSVRPSQIKHSTSTSSRRVTQFSK